MVALLATIMCWLPFILSFVKELLTFNLPYFSLVITTLLLPFQKLKQKETIEKAPIGASSEDHPKGAVDLEFTRIASENLTTSDGLGATETVLRGTSNSIDQEGGAEV
jgi:hypothetical protein